MKNPSEMTDTQIHAWIKKTGRSANGAFYGGSKIGSARMDDLMFRYHDLCDEANERGLINATFNEPYIADNFYDCCA